MDVHRLRNNRCKSVRIIYIYTQYTAREIVVKLHVCAVPSLLVGKKYFLIKIAYKLNKIHVVTKYEQFRLWDF